MVRPERVPHLKNSTGLSLAGLRAFSRRKFKAVPTGAGFLFTCADGLLPLHARLGFADVCAVKRADAHRTCPMRGLAEKKKKKPRAPPPPPPPPPRGGGARGDRTVAELGVDQIANRMTAGVNRVWRRGRIYDARPWPRWDQTSRGDLIEATFPDRGPTATTLPRFLAALNPGIPLRWRVTACSATFKTLPGGRSGPTFDYTPTVCWNSTAADGEVAEPATDANGR